MTDIKELETRIDRLHNLLRMVEDDAARQELERLLAEARREFENARRASAERPLNPPRRL
jgi:hypothetical protein